MSRNALAALARNAATAATHKTLRLDTSRGEDGFVSGQEVVKHLDFFRGTYLIEEVPGWDVGIRSKKHPRTKPKRFFADPALAARMLGITARTLGREQGTEVCQALGITPSDTPPNRWRSRR